MMKLILKFQKKKEDEISVRLTFNKRRETLFAHGHFQLKYMQAIIITPWTLPRKS